MSDTPVARPLRLDDTVAVPTPLIEPLDAHNRALLDNVHPDVFE